jgi:hypothetical protein
MLAGAWGLLYSGWKRKAKFGGSMLTNGLERGFTERNLPLTKNPKVGRDKIGWYIYTASENVQVYFDDFYHFLEITEANCFRELKQLNAKIESTQKIYRRS